MKQKKTSLIVMLVVALCCANGVSAQVRVYADVYYAPVNLLFNGIDKDIPNYIPSLTVDKYLGYRYAITCGVGYWQLKYSTKGNPILMDVYPEIKNPAAIDNRWKHTMLQLPLGIRYAPKALPFGFSVGADLNVTLSSKLWDLKDTTANHTYLVTDISPVMPAVIPDVFVGMSWSIRNFKLNMKAIFLFRNNFYSTEVVTLTDANARANGAYLRSWYYLNGDYLAISPKVQWGISYRIK